MTDRKKTHKKRSDPAGGEPVANDALDARLRGHFSAERSRVRVPTFEAVLAGAERVHAERVHAERVHAEHLHAERDSQAGPGFALWRRPAWRGLAAIAVALALLMLLRPWTPDSRAPMRISSADGQLLAALKLEEADLLADLNRSTLWVAPSDRWIQTDMAPDVLGLPRMGKMTYEMQEVKSWF